MTPQVFNQSVLNQSLDVDGRQIYFQLSWKRQTRWADLSVTESADTDHNHSTRSECSYTLAQHTEHARWALKADVPNVGVHFSTENPVRLMSIATVKRGGLHGFMRTLSWNALPYPARMLGSAATNYCDVVQARYCIITVLRFEMFHGCC